ncbi:hypothetical protein QTP86_030643, partial [Hemibagrus guttatus]
CKGQITVKKSGDVYVFECNKWLNLYNEPSNQFNLSYKDENSGDYKCEIKDNNITMTVKFRTCESCIELDKTSLIAVILGNIVATFFVAFAVYSITGQSKGKSFSGNKASDKVNLLNNGETDTYQQGLGTGSRGQVLPWWT